MARPVKRSLEYFPTKTKLLYDTRIKALRRCFKDTGDANNAFVVFDYIFRDIFGNEGYYIKYTKTLVGDTADFCYVPESFVIDVIQKCIELELFDKTQFEQNEILTSRSIQNKYQDIFAAMKRKAEMESRFCVLGGLVYSEETPVYSEETPVYSEETPVYSEESTLKKEKKEKKEMRASESPPPPNEGSSVPQNDCEAFREFWNSVANENRLGMKISPVRWLIFPGDILFKLKSRLEEYGLETLKEALIEVGQSDYWNGKSMSMSQFLETKTIENGLANAYGSEEVDKQRKAEEKKKRDEKIHAITTMSMQH